MVVVIGDDGGRRRRRGRGGTKGGCALSLYELSDSCFGAIWSPLGDDDTRCVIWFSLKLDGRTTSQLSF